MAPKKSASRSSTPVPASSTATNTNGPAVIPPRVSSATVGSNASIKDVTDSTKIVQHVWNNYLDKTPQRVKLIDAFLTFLLVVGALQFVYCVVGGNYVSCLGTYMAVES
jgi:oligosaccharyltransferase complex subunit epsilon